MEREKDKKKEGKIVRQREIKRARERDQNSKRWKEKEIKQKEMLPV
jgi:hypothetical protein